ncbi:hypothetical protein [Rhizohabitans arisaemae]|uniref:hypothetical protein n=1 Tax=Rhizohabitans arisaemae TaxID=2720610 RepID=UPI0024B1920A|nr:hypothetical protein [Rhizohabitans arisaemae]
MDSEIHVCAYLDTENGYTGRAVLGLGFGALAMLLPLVLVVSAVAAWRSPGRRSLLTRVAAGGALLTAAYYALSTVAFFSPDCPSGSQGLSFVLPLYGAVAVLVLIAATHRTGVGAGTRP